VRRNTRNTWGNWCKMHTACLRGGRAHAALHQQSAEQRPDAEWIPHRQSVFCDWMLRGLQFQTSSSQKITTGSQTSGNNVHDWRRNNIPMQSNTPESYQELVAMMRAMYIVRMVVDLICQVRVLLTHFRHFCTHPLQLLLKRNILLRNVGNVGTDIC